MKSLFKPLLMSTVLAFAPVGPLLTAAQAQSTSITPIPLPGIGAIPDASSSEQETHDENSIEQLMNMVEISRLIGGGIAQLFSSSQSMTSLLGLVRDTNAAQLTAITGTKTIPLANGPDEVSAREAGTTIREMAIEGLAGSVANPPDISSTFANLVATYELDKVFAFKDGKRLNEVTMAHMASYGAVAAATGERAYKRANESMGRLDGYITALGASRDLKTSLDINTRVSIELTQQVNELLRSQSALTTIAGMHYVATLSGRTDIADNLNFKRLFMPRD
ncbi:type IV secretion system protein [Ensifer sp. YR511]|uniref:type IV secretion system protein n=1 Tax=Ensifer sp. YR511 TaxID=1855294 RepID=UPI0008884586|nr:type IV secretion system protein [Ensifer sp. YR511]SDO11273.1 hypothetical protein SAMN05216328_15514 [Ensifer sp. YR511]